MPALMRLLPSTSVGFRGRRDRERPAPDGGYRVTICSSDQGGKDKIELHRGVVKGKERVPANALRRFTISLAPGEAQLIRIEKE